MLILGSGGAEVGRKSWAVEARRCAGEAKGGREDGSGARGGSGLRREATDTMAVKTRWRVSRKAGSVRLRVRGGLRGGETRLDGWRMAAWYQGRADRRRPGLRGQEALAAGSERANTTNSPLQPATTKRMRVDRELAGAGSRGLAKEPDKVRLSAHAAMGQRGGTETWFQRLGPSVGSSRRAFFVREGRESSAGGGWWCLDSPPLFGRGERKWGTGEPQSE